MRYLYSTRSMKLF